MAKIKIWLDFFFRLPGTILHELAHYLVAKLTGSQVIGFSLYPKITQTHIEYGSVTALYRYKVLMIPVAIAPLIWWGVLVWGFYTLGIVKPITSEYQISFDHRPLLDSKNWIWFYPATQLLWAGKLSGQDIAVAFQGVFSFSGIVVIGIVTFLALY